MAITFSPADRLNITRRQLNIALENAAFQTTVNSFSDQMTKLLGVDNSNTLFYDFYNTQATQYENEARQINGNVSLVYSNSDLVDSAQFAANTLFYPTSVPPTPSYEFYIPKIVNNTKGFFHPSSTDARYEQNIIANTSPDTGILQAIDVLLNGISYGSATTTTQNPVHLIPGGDITNVQVDVVSTAGFSVNDLVFINQGSNSGIYKIVATDASHLTFDSVIPSVAGFAALGATIKNGVVGFTNAERIAMVSATYNELLNNLAAKIVSLVLEWEGKIDAQITALGLQNDDRATQAAQNSAALSDVNNTKSIIDAWQALSYSGASGKFVDGNINTISTEATARVSYTAARITEITTALGSSSGAALSQSGNVYSTSVPGNSYYNRYKWLDIRINRITGSLRRYYAASQSSGAVQTMLASNLAIEAEYSNYFLTKRITNNDSSAIIQVDSVSGISAGDSLIVVSETQPEITRGVVEVLGTTQLRLTSPIPNTYQISDLARIFKTL